MTIQQRTNRKPARKQSQRALARQRNAVLEGLCEAAETPEQWLELVNSKAYRGLPL